VAEGDFLEAVTSTRGVHFQLFQILLSRRAQVAEGDFLEVVTSTPRVVCHFFHADFERCKLLDAHLAALARRFFATRFIRLSAPVRGPGRSRAACVWAGTQAMHLCTLVPEHGPAEPASATGTAHSLGLLRASPMHHPPRAG
jgi:hypothetical protein